ncbi:MAG: hypothetical protein EA427_02315 [Spirochaetaceae bacterium]|nr:MAG: hypothetical protein EA427_02315 [Spirochaetaceae bacterium]
MARLHFWNAGHKPDDLTPEEHGFSTRGIADGQGWHPPEEAARGYIDIADARAFAGSYADVLHALTHMHPRGEHSDSGAHRDMADWTSALVIAGENNRELESFLRSLAAIGVVGSYAGGVAAYPEGSSRGELQPAGAECIVLLAPGRTVTHNLHQVVDPSVIIETENERSVVTIEGKPAARYYDDRRAGKYPDSDFEHLTISDPAGRNVHLSPEPEDSGRLRIGAALPSGTAQLREVTEIAGPLEQAVAGSQLAFCCAGLGGAIERAPAGANGPMVWMFGEIVDLGNGPELGNLMISTWSSSR